MKKLLITLLITTSATFANANGLTRSEWFEPGLGCIAGAGAGYFAAQGTSTDQGMAAGIGCATGAIIGYFINGHYKNKYGEVYQKEITELKRLNQEMQLLQAERASTDDAEGKYYHVIKEVVPGRQDPSGAVQAPTLKYRLYQPGNGIRYGE